MTHLSPSEFVDLADGALESSRAAHADECDACRAQVEALRTMIHEARADAVPEPSPLFWDHFQEHVHRAIAAEPRPRRFWFVLHPVPALVTVMIVGIAVGTAALYSRHVVAPSGPPANVSLAPTIAAPVATDAGDDAAWSLLSEVAGDMGLEDARAAGMTLRPGETDNAVLHLTAAERNELGRLLQDALKRAGT